MLPAERRKRILEIIKKEEKVEIEPLATELGVSPMTVRRDLNLLERQGLVERTHGGALPVGSLLQETTYQTKQAAHREAKRRIAAEALSLIREGQVILLDAGTTTLEIARQLKGFSDLTVITNDLKIALELFDVDGVTLYCTGGRVQKNLGSLIGPPTLQFMESIRVDITFLAASSIDVVWGITTPVMEKAQIKRRMMAVAEQVVLVADHSKFGNKAFCQIARLEEVDLLITDDGLATDMVRQLQELGLETRVV
ncbi:transcriptional regulator, deor family [Heliomicrobium modesticaldum Ice1]|uniref:Transcriptional regulator, deor family n=1 Tax=Heliobacterium modesticaldum (strain ATCC 51547 / Ice1) TaxID=498761 RepID=B0TBJ0_HELMI|nr:DeoR/GlpR family DNA-binding transcription regulator [Heliomicrobium modesticaldum]ABZ85203.1 transcriptional regulator, deor family [Heliomicrobium modesticaldum Ice1]